MIGIPGNTISGLAQSQIAHAASFQSYGNFISDQYGTRKTPPSQAAVSGGGGGLADPRYGPTAIAGSMMSAGRSGVDSGLGALSMAGAFGMAPRVFDPFSTTLGLMGSGYKWGGVSGAMGFGAVGAGMYMGAGAALNAGMGQVMMGGQQQAQLSGIFSAGINRQNTPMMGMPSFGQQTQFGNMMAGMTGPGMSMGQLSGVLGQGLMGGSFSGANSMGDFQAKFKQLVTEVKTIAQTFNTSLAEAHSVMKEVQGMGFYQPGQAAAASQAFSGLARATGMQMDKMGQAAGMGADIWGGSGGSRAMGAQVGGGIASQLSALTGAGVLNSGSIRDMFGGAPIGEAIPQLAGRLMQYSNRFAGTRHGQQVLGAMMDPTTGQIDPLSAGRLGSMGWDDIQSQYRQNMRGPGARKMLQMNSGALSRQMSEQVGPQWSAMGIGAMAQAKGGGVGAVEDYMGMVYGNIPKQELDIMTQMASFGPELKVFLKMQGEQALKDGMAEAKQGGGSWETVKQRLKQAFVEPFTSPLRKFGREVLGGLQGWTSDTIDSFLGRQPGLINDATTKGMSANAMVFGANSVSGGVRDFAPGGGLPSIGGAAGSLLNNWMPGGVGNVVMGGSFGGAGGLATNQWNPGMTAGAVASMPMIGGRNLMHLGGRGLTALGGAVGGAAGGLTSGLGWAARGLGRVLGPVGYGMAAADLATNVLPAAYRGESFGGLRPAELWGGGAIMGKGGGLGNFGHRMAQMFNADPVGSDAYGLAQHSVDRTPNLQPLGVANDTSMLYPDAADPMSRGLRQLGFENRAGAERAAEQWYSTFTDPQSMFNERLSGDELSHWQSVFRTVDGGVRSGESLVGASLRGGRAAYDKLGDSPMDRGIREKIGGTDSMRMIAAFGAGGGHFDTLGAEARAMRKSRSPTAVRTAALDSVVGAGNAEDELSGLISGAEGMPGIVAETVAYKNAGTQAEKRRIMDRIHDRFERADPSLMPEKMRKLMKDTSGGGLTYRGLEALVRDGSLDTFADPEIANMIGDQKERVLQTQDYIASRGLGLHLNVIGQGVPGGGERLEELMLMASGPMAAYGKGMGDVLPSYEAQYDGVGRDARLKAQGDWRGDMYDTFDAMSPEALQQLASTTNYKGIGAGAMLGARAGVYSRVQRDFAGYGGKGAGKKMRSKDPNEEIVSSRNAGAFLTRMFKGTAGEAFLPNIRRGLPGLNLEGGSPETQLLIRQAGLASGMGAEEASALAESFGAGGEGTGGTALVKAEVNRLMRMESENRVSKAMNPGGSGEGSADTAMQRFTTNLMELNERMANIIGNMPPAKKDL